MLKSTLTQKIENIMESRWFEEKIIETLEEINIELLIERAIENNLDTLSNYVENILKDIIEEEVCEAMESIDITDYI